MIKNIESKQDVMLLAFVDDQLIGISNISSMSRIASHIGQFGISIDQGFRKRGIGDRLISAILMEAKNIPSLRMVILEVFSVNVPAINMYEKHGFKTYGVLPGGVHYKGSYCDGVLMYREL